MSESVCKCTCENDGYLDWFMGRLDKRPGLLSKHGIEPKPVQPAGPNPILEGMRSVIEARGHQVPKSLQRLTTGAFSRRGFMKAMAVGLGGFLAWQGGLKPRAAQACGGYEGDPTWDWTWYQGSGYFLSRAEWGARPPRQAVVVLNRAPTYVVVHHTATANTANYSQAQAINLSRSIQNYHMNTNGWIDAGQHFTMSRGGYLCEGRARSTEIELLACYASHVRGTHVANWNDSCLGIENEGTYTSVTPPGEILWGIFTSVATCCFYNSIPSWRVVGHRDFNATQCPGNMLYDLLPYIRAWVAYFLEGGEYPG